MLKEDAVMEDAPEAAAQDGGGTSEAEYVPDIQGLDRLTPAVEAILLTSDRPIPLARLAEGLGLGAPEAAEPQASEGEEVEPAPTRRKKGRSAKAAAGPSNGTALVEQAIASLNDVYKESGRAFRIEQVAGGYRLMTLPEYAPVLAAFHHSRTSSRLSRAAVETLAIIAYRQPITRAHLESIRGVGCGEVLRSLMERRLITIKGRAEELGRPMLYGTTKEFLDAFGLASLKDLPNASELQSG